MRYEVDIVEVDDKNSWVGTSYVLRITEDESNVREYRERMGPEDVSFHRDLSWVPDELESAYETGLKHGSAEPRMQCNILSIIIKNLSNKLLSSDNQDQDARKALRYLSKEGLA